ncbi:MAG: hypothetical protein GYA35_02130 [Thermoanaerobaculaceae bacterium]|nr:hypothetical protein [Thermoanaerobaculaceae bacterium]
MNADITAIFVIGSMCLCAVLIVASSLFYHYKKEQVKSKERLAAIEKGIAPKDLISNGENGSSLKNYANKRDAEIFGGIKLLIIGFFLALALRITTGKGDHQFDVAVWGLFVSGIGLAKIVVGLLLKKPSEES